MRQEYDYLLRYGLVSGIGALALAPLYWFLTPLTVQVTSLVLSLFGSTTILANTTIVFEGQYLALIPACIAGSAYYLLIACACTIPIAWRKRAKIIALSCGLFFLLNIGRILLSTYLALHNASLFDITHALFWYAGSILGVIVCWSVAVCYYHCKEIPLLTDMQHLLKVIRSRQ